MRLFKSGKVSEENVRSVLTKLNVSSDKIESLIVSDDGTVTLILKSASSTVEEDEKLRYAIEMALKDLKGVRTVRVVLTAQSDSRSPRPAAPANPQSKPAPDKTALNIPGIETVIAVASAKGGVGKSTLALNLAVALARKGLKVGLLDADVYGPSVPTMTGTVGTKPVYQKGKKLIPVDAHGLKLMSIGYVTDEADAMIWRGPMVISAINQMMRDVDWGELDILVIDTPPGTGDAQLTLAQKIALTGAVLVSTPQSVAIADVRRGVSMFEKTHIPVLGLVENMAWFQDPVSGERSYIFGKGGAKDLASELGLPFLGEVPLVTGIREGGDSGQPVAQTDSDAAKVFHDLADALLVQLSSLSKRPAPKIIFED